MYGICAHSGPSHVPAPNEGPCRPKLGRCLRVLVEHSSDESCDPICDFDWTDKHWAAVARRDVKHIPSKFTSVVRWKSLIVGFGTWFQSPKAAGKALVKFHDATAFLRETSTKASLDQVPKSRENNCNVHIPIELTIEPAVADVDRLRQFLTTTNAGNVDGKLLDASMEALASYNIPVPQKMLIMRGKGGDGKSARSHLRHVVFAGSDQYMSPSVFEIDQEFRRHGGQFRMLAASRFRSARATSTSKRTTSGPSSVVRP